jgi:F-box-like
VFIYFSIAYMCDAKMSLFSYNPPNQLTDDVLLVIFDQLDEDDFLRCQVVCRQWRNVLHCGTPRRLFHRKIVSSEKWRQLWRRFGVDETKLPSGHHRGLCKALIDELNETESNWRNGTFKKTTKISTKRIDLLESKVSIGNDCIVRPSYGNFSCRNGMTLDFFHQSSLGVKS